jgi:hypothetical protein
MISQGQLFPFEELKEKHINNYPEIHKTMETDEGVGYGTWEGDSKKTNAKSKKNKKDNNKNSDLIEDYLIDDPHMNMEPADFLETIGLNTGVENFKEAHGGGAGNGGSHSSGGSHGSGGSHHGSGGGRAGGAVGMGWRGGRSPELGGGYGGGGAHWVPFWVENPNILFYPGHVYEFFPVESMNYNRKLNSVSRLIILLTLIGFLFVRNLRILWIGAVCLLAIFLIQYTQNKNEYFGGKGVVEGFDDKLESLGVDAPAQAVINAFATDDPSKIGKREFFDAPRVNNPYNNVLVTDIVDNPNKLPAPPAYYPETEKEILDKTKEAIQKMNPTFPGMTDKLFASLDDHFEFEQSARQFYSNPATTVPNDQGAFAAFCYGEMISCKEGNQFACVRDAPRYNLY